MSELRHSITNVKAIEYFDSDTAYDWRYDASGAAPGDSGAAALAAARDVAHSCYLDSLAGACHHRAHHRAKPSHSPSPSPSPSSPSPAPSASPSHTSHLSAPAAGPSALSWAAIAAAIAVVIAGALLAYRRFSRK